MLIPAQSDLSPPPPPSPPSASGGRPHLPWVIAGVAVVVALVASFLALRDDDEDGDRLATSVADTDDTTSTTGAADDAKGLESPTGDTTPVDKPGNDSATTTTTEPTTTSSDTTTTTTTPDPTAVDPALPPVYGSTALTSGFVPDPFTVGVDAGVP